MPTRGSAHGTLVLALGALLLVSCEHEPPPPPPPPLATLAQRSGSVAVEHAGKRAEPPVNSPLWAGDVLQTGTDGRALVRYTDGTELSVSPGTRFRLDGVPGQLSLEIDEGSVVSNARAEGAGGLKIVTRYGEASIVHGSEVAFDLSGGEAGMEVTFGEVHVLGKDGGSSVVVAGSGMDFLLGEPKTKAPPPPPPPPPPAELALTLAAAKGTLVKPSGSARFVPAPKEPGLISAGTQLKLKRGASATVSGGSVSWRLSGAAAGEVGAAKEQGGAEQYAFALEAGEANVELAGDKKREISVAGRGGALLVRGEETARLSVRRFAKSTELEVALGQVEVEAPDGKRTVGAGERLVLANGKSEVKGAPPPALVLPHSRKVKMYTDAPATVGLALPEEGSPATVEVSRDAEFKDVLLSGRAHGAYLAVPAEAPGELHWRAKDAGGKVLAEGHAKLLRDAGRSAADLENPHAEVAETGLKATVLFQSAPPSLTFSFAPKEGAASYRVRVYRSGDLKNALVEKVVTEPTCSFDAGAVPEGDYIWYAAPLDPNGMELAGGRMNKLEMTYDNSRTTLAIARPKPGEALPKGGGTVQGIAPLGAKLFVNGKPATLDAKGRFSLEVARADVLVFRVVAEGGAESYWVRNLRRKR